MCPMCYIAGFGGLVAAFFGKKKWDQYREKESKNNQ